MGRAKSLRTAQTEAEAKLWYHLRAHRFEGLKFKRQKPVGPYIVDFLCVERRLAIEVDGGQHNDGQHAYDMVRNAWLRESGWTVLRFWNHEVMRDLEGVMEAIRVAALGNSPSPPAPLPQAGEGSREENPSPACGRGAGERGCSP